MSNIEMRLALGTVQFGLDYGISNSRGMIPEKEVFGILDHAYQNGIELLDTAYGYGDSEEVIGRYIKYRKNHFKVVTKLPACQKEEVRSIVRESSRRLNINMLYGYLVHSFKYYAENPGSWEELVALKGEGVVQKIGFSLYYPQDVMHLIDNGVSFDLVQVPYNVFDQRFNDCFPMLKQHNVEIHVRSVFLQGLVFRSTKDLGKQFSVIKKKIEALQAIAYRLGIPLSSLCVNFALMNENIDKVVIGVDREANLHENIADLRYKDHIASVYNELLDLSESNENIILPFNWR